VNALVFPPGHPYACEALPEDLSRATLADVRDFFHTWYAPNNATIVISGDIDKTATLALVNQYFGAIAPGPKPPQTRPVYEPLPGQHVDVAAAVPRARVTFAWRTPAWLEAGDAELDYAAQILAGIEASRLRADLVVRLRLAESVFAEQHSHEQGSVFEITVTAAPGRTGDELARVLEQDLDALARRGPTDDEIACVRTKWVTQAVYRLEKDAVRAGVMNRYNQVTGNPAEVGLELARHEAVTAEGVRQAVGTYLGRGQRQIVVVSPDARAPIAGEIAHGGYR
jgi:zinc protease